MFTTNFSDRFFAAAVSLVLTAGVFAYAILPASPGMMA